MKQQKNILMGVLSYLGPLIIISYLIAKDDPFVKFHIKQALSIIVASIILTIVGKFMIFPIYFILWLVRLGLGILIILGIINAIQGKEKELPLIGRLAESFNF